MRVLLADDSATARRLARVVLEGLGHSDIREARDGKEALDALDAFAPELVVIDWDMPRMDGVAFVRVFRGRDAATPVVLLVTEAEKPRVGEALAAGVSAYVVKPFSPAELAREISGVTATRSRSGRDSPGGED